MTERTTVNLEMNTDHFKQLEALAKKHGIKDIAYVFAAATSILLQMDANPNITLSFLLNGEVRIEQRHKLYY